MLWSYEIKLFEEQLNELKVSDDGVTKNDKFSDTTADITIKNHSTQGCPLYALDEILQGTIGGLPNW